MKACKIQGPWILPHHKRVKTWILRVQCVKSGCGTADKHLIALHCEGDEIILEWIGVSLMIAGGQRIWDLD